MSPFMGEYGSFMSLVVAMVHDNIRTEAEWRHVTVNHAKRGTVSLRITLAATYQHQDSPNRQQGMPQRSQYTYYL
ncbi:MAG: hypothetical protein IJT98_08245 [Prevotella sp.]|nr:hypothetical protein [Prevotella sp.]